MESGIALEEFQRAPRATQSGREKILSDLEVRDILLDSRITRSIAEEYGVSQSLVKKIKSRTASYFVDREISADSASLSLATLPHVSAAVGQPPILSEHDVALIRSDLRSLRVVAEEFGVSVSTVWRVRNGRYQGRSAVFAEQRGDEVLGTVAGAPLYESDFRKLQISDRRKRIASAV